MAVVTLKQLLDSGAHFGHQTRRWNPKMKRFIFTDRNGIYIIDLQQTLTYIDKAYEFVKETVAHGGSVMFVGTKKQAQESIAEEATRVGMPYVNQRWLGGMLTNFSTVHKRLRRLKELEAMEQTGGFEGRTKKEILMLTREKNKLVRSLGGIRDMQKVPSALWVVDTNKEHIAVGEARKLGIPVIAILDTNCDPDFVDYPIPGNDDAIRSAALLTRVIASAVAEGLQLRAGFSKGEGEAEASEPLAEWEQELLVGASTVQHGRAATSIEGLVEDIKGKAKGADGTVSDLFREGEAQQHKPDAQRTGSARESSARARQDQPAGGGERALAPAEKPLGPPSAVGHDVPVGDPVGSVGATAPKMPERRSVNTILESRGGERLTPGDILEIGTEYQLLVNIGEYERENLLTEVEASWPGERLPQQELILRAVLSMDDASAPISKPFYLPAERSSFTCDCNPRGGHRPDCPREPWVRFDLVTPPAPQVWGGDLVIYYEVVAVHAQHLGLPVGMRANGGIHSVPTYSLTRDFANMGTLKNRTASFVVSGGGSRAIVNGLDFIDNPTTILPNASDDAIRSVRRHLVNQHLTKNDGKYSSKFDANFAKPKDQFISDLAALARQGWAVYFGLFGNNDVFDALPALIRHEATVRGRPAVISVADATGSGVRNVQPPVPWSLIYDIPMHKDAHADFNVCPSLEKFCSPGQPDDIPPTCPEPNHPINTLCPFGFWGLSCVIELPPSTESPFYTLDQWSWPIRLAMAIDPNLKPELSERHRANLSARIQPSNLLSRSCNDPDSVATLLIERPVDLAYLYCHGGYDTDDGQPFLRFGDRKLYPTDLGAWRVEKWTLKDHSPTQPLVVLNGCGTVEFNTHSLANFVEGFVGRCGAAGLIGTEITVEQGLAGFAFEHLLEIARSGSTVGEALRRLRWMMASRGNTMGFAYTLHCMAGLRFGAATPGRELEGDSD